MAKVSAKKIDARIDRLYYERCSGVQIPIMKMGDVYKIGRAAVAEGVDDAALGDRIAAFVETIRKN